MRNQIEIVECWVDIRDHGLDYWYWLSDGGYVRVELVPELTATHVQIKKADRNAIRDLQGLMREYIIPYFEETYDIHSTYIATESHALVRLLTNNKAALVGEVEDLPLYKLALKDI